MLDALVGLAEGSAPAEPAVDEEPVEHLGERLHAVDVGGERGGGLRLADGQHLLHVEALERVEGAGRPERSPDLREDVVGERVARVARATP